MSGRSVSVYTDTRASHEYLCTLIQNGHEFCKLLIKRPQTVMFSNYVKKINVKNLENCKKKFLGMGTILYRRIQTLIKHVFLFNYPRKLLMSLIRVYVVLAHI